ncbi:DUF3097 family protein [Aeromicrobium sp. 636]|uniref:DUF3097 domain-containing protein n=1 Tax=Aeromicrobium senzhongii TaxID=2663859 RepID=A0A8I0ET12_9ACTN|nr:MULTISPECIES: DUF3097 domain-containing protein [Aeromicrobium]MBC9225645.1 DUF3097 domain-containing protein [Aeromicrobium senzhongii]MCQ3997754.1 DUF3097 family protein [Aeromicrobium sp. 636]MTB87681.1 DUF3097 family protein [Aeromicrobium senzhongii]QNL95287.1 DUF3097 domain-containing protein [Aeromicrobium senzhongii]
MADRYGSDVLSGDWRKPKRGRSTELAADLGLVVEEASSGFVGEITRVERDLGTVELEDRRLRRKVFPLGPGFLMEGKPVVLVAPTPKAATAPTRTASGSRLAADTRAKVALPSRIFVEGRHDAELVEKVWGDDLRAEGVAVEYLGGIDDLAAIVRDFQPTAKRRLGVLVDHLVPGSKEQRLADEVKHVPHLLVVGHPYVDVWQSVKPQRLGMEAWPTIPRHVEWKKGVCAHLGWPHAEQADIARAWKAILGRVDSWTDLEPAFLGRVEELIDFVTQPA